MLGLSLHARNKHRPLCENRPKMLPHWVELLEQTRIGHVGFAEVTGMAS
jgi:hypothetical protein